MLKVIIPSYKMRGETAVLECQYQMNGRHPSVELEDTLERVASSRYQGSIVNSYHNETNEHRYDNYLFNNRDENNQPESNGSEESEHEQQQHNGGGSSSSRGDFFIHNRHHDKSSRNNHNANNRHRLHKHHSNSGEEQQRGGEVGKDEEDLYSVKWYRDNEEFYRYVPKDNPPQHSYNVDGIKVDVSGSYLLFYFSFIQFFWLIFL